MQVQHLSRRLLFVFEQLAVLPLVPRLTPTSPSPLPLHPLSQTPPRPLTQSLCLHLRHFGCVYFDDDVLKEDQELPRLSAEVVPALGQVANLASLQLGLWLHGDAAGILAGALPHLPHLRKLHVRLQCPPDAPELRSLVEHIARHRQLTALRLSSQPHRLGSLECLTQLTGLQRLHLDETQIVAGVPADGAPSRFPLPAALPALRSYDLSSHYVDEDDSPAFLLPVKWTLGSDSGGHCAFLHMRLLLPR